jgi:hypothetical protein
MSKLTLQHGYPDLIGRRYAWCAPGYTGPTSYPNAGAISAGGVGDPLALPQVSNYIDSAWPALSTDGTYIVIPQPLTAGPRATWVARWFAYSSSTGIGAEATAGTNLSTKTAILAGFGGKY